MVRPAGTAPTPTLSPLARKADDYYLGRADLENVRAGLALLGQAVAANAQDYEAWWRISKFASYLAQHTSGSEKLKALDEAVDAGKRAVAREPHRVEGHFWLGASYGLFAEAHGRLTGFRLLDSIRSEMETAARLDPDYEQAAPLRILGHIYYRAPFFKGGDNRRSLQLLEASLKRFPDNSLTMLYLADTLLTLHRRDEARQQLERILNLCPDPLYGPELEESRTDAREDLAKYFHR